MNVLNNPQVREFFRFAIVGIIAVCIHYGIYLLLLCALGIELNAAKGVCWQTNVAYTVGYVLAFCCNLWLTAHFTFKESITIKRTGGFLLSHLVNYGLHEGLLNLYLILGIPEWLTLPLILMIAVPVNFILVRTAFKKL